MNHILSKMTDVLTGKIKSWEELGISEEVARKVIIEQGLAPLLTEKWCEDGDSPQDWPQNLKKFVTESARIEACLELRRLAECRNVSMKLSENDIPPFFFKGTALAYSIYKIPYERTRCDHDLMIPKSKIEVVKKAMKELGYEEVLLSGEEHLFYQFQMIKEIADGTRHVFDFHWKISCRKLFCDIFSYDELLKESVPAVILGETARIPSTRHSLALACIHPVMHHQNEIRLLWRNDIELLSKKIESLDGFLDFAAKKGISHIVNEGLNITSAEKGHKKEKTADFLRQDRSGLPVKVREWLSDIWEIGGWKPRLQLIKETFFPCKDYMIGKYHLKNGKSVFFQLPFLYMHRILRGVKNLFPCCFSHYFSHYSGVNKRNEDLKFFKILLKITRRHQNLFFFIVILSGVSAMLEGASIGLVLPLLQQMMGSTETIQFAGWFKNLFNITDRNLIFAMLCCLIALAVALRAAFQWGFQYVAQVLELKILTECRINLLRSFHKISYSKSASCDRGRIAHIFSNQVVGLVGAVHAIIGLTAALLIMISYLVLMFYFSSILTLYTMAAFIITFTISKYFNKKIYLETTKVVEAGEKLESLILDDIEGMSSIKIWQLAGIRESLHQKWNKILSRAALKSQLWKISCSPMLEVLFAFTVLGSLSVMALWAQGTFFSELPMILTFFIVLFRLQGRAGQINAYVLNFAEVKKESLNVSEFFESEEKKKINSGQKRFPSDFSEISFRNMSFGYSLDESKKEIFRDFNLATRSGDVIVISGETGSGKTTFGHLILALLEPQKGDIFINNTCLNEIHVDDLAKNIGASFQDACMFHETVFWNISLGRSVARKDVFAAANVAEIHDVISRLPHGYETNIYKEGIRLSGGEKARIVIARAVVEKPKILVLDEATAALDEKTEIKVLENIWKFIPHSIIFIITHRKKVHELADKVIKIERPELRGEVSSTVHNGATINASEDNHCRISPNR